MNLKKKIILYLNSPIENIQNLILKMDFSEKILLTLFSAGLVVSSIGMIISINEYITKETPTQGGSFTEVINGIPRFINPVLAVTDADRDVTALTYSGLMRANPNGDLISDIAENYDISDSGKIYTFHLKRNLYFQDGEPITADDIIFTIKMIQDISIKSPKRADWIGIKTEKIDDYTLRFILPKAYSPFLENTTVGILPKHLWENVKPQEFPFSKLNTKPIGSGPYKVYDIKYTSAGIPAEYILKSFNKYALGKPYIKYIYLKFIENKKEAENAFIKNKYDAMVSKDINPGPEYNVNKIVYPRIFALFFNQSKNKIFADKNVRKALRLCVDKKRIVKEALSGNATIINSPLPQLTQKLTVPENNKCQDAKKLLQKTGWKLENISDENKTKVWKKDDDILAFSISTVKTPELLKTAELLKKNWQSINIKVKIESFTANDFTQNVIRPRNYETILFGEVTGKIPDLFAFWHSSQRDDPGLNIALYANSKVDALLEKARKEFSQKKRLQIYNQIIKELHDDVAAIFLYSPDFRYIISKSIHTPPMRVISNPSERFARIYDWFIETNRLWEFISN